MKKSLNLMITMTLLASSPASANIGLPMLAIVWPAFWLAFIPIVLIEVWVLCKLLKNESFRSLLWPSTLANLFSTLIGIPIAWGVLLGLELLVMQLVDLLVDFSEVSAVKMSLLSIITAPWLYPVESELYWMIPTACMILLIPFYFVSAWSEGLIFARFLKARHPPNESKRSMWRANLASYAFLFLFALGWLAYALLSH